MIIVWILTILDLIVFTTVSFAHFGLAISTIFLFYCAGYLFMKLLVFRELMSGIDAVFGIYIILMAIFHISTFFYYFMLAWFGFKFISAMLG